MSDAAAATTAAPASAPAAEPAVTPAPANDNGAPTAETQAPEPKHKIKVGGEERELTVSELVKLAQKGEGAERKFDEAAKMRAEAEQLKRRFAADPYAVMEELVGDGSAAAERMLERLWRDPKTRSTVEDYIYQAYQYEGLSEQERAQVDEYRDLKASKAELAKLKSEQDARARAEQTQRDEQQAHEYQRELVAAFTPALKAAGVPQTEHTLGRMGTLLDIEVDRAIEQVSRQQRRQLTLAEQNKVAEYVVRKTPPEALAKRVRDEWRAEASAGFGGLPPEDLAELIGEKALTALRAWDAKRLRAKEVERMAAPANDNGRRAPEAPRQRLTASEVMARIRGGK